jgi:PIN domain nuclease of toxin-antitoxin system
MKLLLDTHTFIFWDSQPSKLSQRALELLTNKDNLRLLSVVSLWEIQIKQQLGKLTLNKTLEEIILIQQNNYIEILPVTVAHILALDSLPLYHKDTFANNPPAGKKGHSPVVKNSYRLFTPLKVTEKVLTAHTREKIDLEYLPIFLYKFLLVNDNHGHDYQQNVI